MALDYSTLSDEELEAIANDDYSKLSDATLAAIAADAPQPKEEPGVMGKIGQAAGGVAGMAVDAATGAYNAIPYKELVVPYAGYKMIPKVAEGAKAGYGTMKNFIGGAAQGAAPVNPVAPGATASPTWTAPSAQPQQPSMMQRGLQYADKVRQIAMDKVMQNAGTIGKAGVGAAAALTPGNIGQKYNFPTSGPMRGMEINPQTGRPWTPQELSALGQ